MPPPCSLQGLFFSGVPGLGYGLMQPEGGPCGALAVVQAYTLRHLYWGNHADECVIDPDSDGWKAVRVGCCGGWVPRALRDHNLPLASHSRRLQRSVEP